MLNQKIIHTPAGTPPAGKPAGAMNSVFDTVSATPEVKMPKPPTRVARDSNRRLVLDVLQRGEGSGSALALVAGISQSTASAILRQLMEEGLVESNGKKASQISYRLKPKTAAGGFQAWLAKQGEPSAEGRSLHRAKKVPMQTNEPKVITGHKATHTRRAEPRADTAVAASPTWSCALVSTGHLVIRANDQELTLDAQQARGVSVWLQRVDAALSVALET